MLKIITTIRKKQIVAVSGIFMILFLLGHLTGNFLIYKGAEAYNHYAHFLQSLGPVLWLFRGVMLSAFLVHIFMTAIVVIENLIARGKGYVKYADQGAKQSIGSKTMPYTGAIIVIYVIVHLLDFTFRAKAGIINGQDLGLYGLVINTLSNPFYAAWYIIALLAVGLHLSHCLQSFFQTFGINRGDQVLIPDFITLAFGLVVGIAYCSVPIYILSMF